MNANSPLCTIAVPSLNQGAFLDRTLKSIFEQDVPVEVMLMDGGSSDGSQEVINRWKPRLAFWRIGKDAGQATAINEGIALGSAPFVCWLNSDDIFEPGALRALIDALMGSPAAPAVYGRARIIDARDRHLGEYRTRRFRVDRLAQSCFIAQPATLIRRSAWQAVGGLDTSYCLAFDFDLWWRLYHFGGPFEFVERIVAGTRAHVDTKTVRRPMHHYREAFKVVSKHYGYVPWLWYAKAPLSIGWRLAVSKLSAANR